MPHERLTVGSLFSGIGGIDLGLERAGMVTRWFVEIDPHCRNVLARHWPGLPVYGDITTVDWSGVEPVDVLAGGFPCQPVSVAGKKLAQDDDRWLWPEFQRAIRALRPRYVLVENVPGLLQRGLGIVVGDLAALGYDAEWDCIPAAAVGAPHLRDRLWLVAYAAGGGRDDGAVGTVVPDADSGRRGERDAQVGTVPVAHESRPLANPASFRSSGSGQPVESVYPAEGAHRQAGEPLDGRLARQWATEPDVGRVADGVPHRVDRLRALGNAVVPQVVEWIGRRIVAFDEARRVAA